MPLAPSQGTSPSGYYNPSPVYSFQTPTPAGPYRIRKPSQRYGSSVDPQAIARAFHAEQRFEQPICALHDPQQHFAAAGVHVYPFANGSQFQLEHDNTNSVSNGELPLQDDVSQVLHELGSKTQAELVLPLGNNPGGRDNSLTTSGKEENYETSNGHDLKDDKGADDFEEQAPLSHSAGTLKESGDDPDSKSHKSCCHGKSQVKTPRWEDPERSFSDIHGLPEHTVPGQLPGNSQYVSSMQDDASIHTNKVRDHPKSQGSPPFLNHHQYHGNEQTTLYTIPPTYATASHPLNPAQLGFLHQHPHLYSQTVPQYAPYGLNGSAAPSAEGNLAFSPVHNCNCGDTCDCLGCAAHPYNATTKNHVQSLGDLLAHGDNDRQSSSRPQSPYGSAFGQVTYVHSMAPGVNPMLVNDMPSPPLSGHYRSSILPLTNSDTTSPAGSYSEAQVPLFSSSGYYTMEFPMDPGESLDGCTDVSGSCQCGDDCACIGCLTHTGHNGIPLGLDPAVISGSPNGVGSRQDFHPDEGREASALKSCCS